MSVNSSYGCGAEIHKAVCIQSHRTMSDLERELEPERTDLKPCLQLERWKGSELSIDSFTSLIDESGPRENIRQVASRQMQLAGTPHKARGFYGVNNCENQSRFFSMLRISLTDFESIMPHINTEFAWSTCPSPSGTERGEVTHANWNPGYPTLLYMY